LSEHKQRDKLLDFNYSITASKSERKIAGLMATESWDTTNAPRTIKRAKQTEQLATELIKSTFLTETEQFQQLSLFRFSFA
jgi:hypothetical protein